MLELIAIALFLFRALSKNITKRSAENRKFMPFYNAFMRWFRLNVKKFKERKYFRYIKCPSCKAQLRVKNKRVIILCAVPAAAENLKKRYKTQDFFHAEGEKRRRSGNNSSLPASISKINTILDRILNSE